MRVILVFMCLNLVSCSWVGSESEKPIVPNEEEINTSTSTTPRINLLTKFLPKTYKMEIQQGNVITSDSLTKLKSGMTKSQVSFVLGTPLIQDSFHKDRWDYIYVMRKDGKIAESRHVIIFFENDLLNKIIGDIISMENRSAHLKDNSQTSFDSDQITGEDVTEITKTIDKEIKDISSKKTSVSSGSEKELAIVKQQIKPVNDAADTTGDLIRKDIIDSLPDESDPGYFELLIEKIGF